MGKNPCTKHIPLRVGKDGRCMDCRNEAKRRRRNSNIVVTRRDPNESIITIYKEGRAKGFTSDAILAMIVNACCGGRI